MINPQPVLAISRLSKTFPGQLALDDVDFEVMGGEIHALVGQNGSGKSTLIKVLAGYHHADPGCSITVDGDPVNTSSPGAGRNAGLRFVHQDLGLVGDLSVIDNLALGRRYRTGAMGRIRWGAEVAAARAALSDLGVHVDPYAPVASLSSAERSIVAITRATHDEVGAARVLILDEPTAALPADDVGRLFGVLRQLRDRGLAIVLVSHHLDEVLAIADRVTVLRDGCRVDTVTRDRVDHDVLVQLIVGRALASADRVVPAPQSAERCFSVAGLVGATIASVSFDVCRGEVVGIAGLDGSGREAVIPLLTGQWPRAAGRVVVLDTAVQSHAPHAARPCGDGVRAERPWPRRLCFRRCRCARTSRSPGSTMCVGTVGSRWRSSGRRLGDGSIGSPWRPLGPRSRSARCPEATSKR